MVEKLTVLPEFLLLERLEEAKRCARILELDQSQRTTQAYLIACAVNHEIHINNIGEALASAIANPGPLLLNAFEQTDLHKKAQQLLDK
ncbi:hypothetical protein [Vibrio diabolicus]|uniref:hypothetical protein n=1 Tax=Vibrio diabolicus TaxID=50719 RepID=UPI002494F088|nr:hypothetical protein [Vibrio diabolicus]